MQHYSSSNIFWLSFDCILIYNRHFIILWLYYQICNQKLSLLTSEIVLHHTQTINKTGQQLYQFIPVLITSTFLDVSITADTMLATLSGANPGKSYKCNNKDIHDLEEHKAIRQVTIKEKGIVGFSKGQWKGRQSQTSCKPLSLEGDQDRSWSKRGKWFKSLGLVQLATLIGGSVLWVVYKSKRCKASCADIFTEHWNNYVPFIQSIYDI